MVEEERAGALALRPWAIPQAHNKALARPTIPRSKSKVSFSQPLNRPKISFVQEILLGPLILIIWLKMGQIWMSFIYKYCEPKIWPWAFEPEPWLALSPLSLTVTGIFYTWQSFLSRIPKTKQTLGLAVKIDGADTLNPYWVVITGQLRVNLHKIIMIKIAGKIMISSYCQLLWFNWLFLGNYGNGKFNRIVPIARGTNLLKTA